MFRVLVDTCNGRWYVTFINFDHNHDMLGQMFASLLPAHKRMNATDIMLIDNFRKVGIKTPHIYAAFANNCVGYDKIGYVRKDVYNQVVKQRRDQSTDVEGALKYLRELCSKDPLMFAAYSVDDEMRLQHLFWCDGESRQNYQVFGDVIAFDATYKKNKYLCLLVIFSGVNNHNQTIVSVAALVTNETKETYVWLLEQFLVAMKGKLPSSVITDGDLAMKNAIKSVFPNVHHRLCAWHLLRNAITNVKILAFMPSMKNCMLRDCDVVEFEKNWANMIESFQLENNSWIIDLYQRKHMWSLAHKRGHFFASINTTSRCEAFHSHVSKYMDSRTNLTDFVQQFQRSLTYFRFGEVEADFQSEYGDVVFVGVEP